MSILNFNFPLSHSPTPPSIPTFPTLVLDIQDYTHLWQGDSADYAESALWGHNPIIFTSSVITINLDLFMYEGQVYLA